MKAEQKKGFQIDPRTGLLLLVFANVFAFSQSSIRMEFLWIGMLTLLMLLCGQFFSGVKWALTFIGLVLLQWYVLPVSPKILATSFSIFLNYARKMFPCLMVGSLMLKTISLRQFIVGLRILHVPQKLIIPISVTLRYFPAIKEEAGYIRDAMRLRKVRGMEKVEALLVPLMISATETAEELSAAAVTRGIENPVKKTSMISLKMSIFDWMVLAAAVLFFGAAVLMG